MIAPLFVNSMYSMLYGTASPEALVKKAVALGYDALALTDRNSVYGLPAFIEACKQERLRQFWAPSLYIERLDRKTQKKPLKKAGPSAEPFFLLKTKKAFLSSRIC